MSPIKPKSYDDARTYSESMEKLPAGAYVVKTQNARIDSYPKDGVSFEKLIIAFDIVEGDYAEHFKKIYDGTTGENKKWKGTIRLSIPGEDEDADSISNRMHKTCMTALEDSNPGWHHQWLEDSAQYAAQFKNLTVGAVFRDREYNFDGRQGMYTECLRFADVEKVRNGEVKTPEPKYLDGNAPKPTQAAPDDDDSDSPF